MTSPTAPSLTAMDRWVLGALTVISVALIVAAVFDDQPGLFLGYLAGTGGLAVLYFFLRS